MDLTKQVMADLARLVAVPSVGALADHAGDVHASAQLVATMLTDVGCPEVSVVAGPYAPAVIGRFPAPPGAPTICLYAHHDVQPVGNLDDWDHPPFELTRVGDRVYGRGAVDDKGAIAAHLATLRAFGGRPPVGITIFCEGEEEIGSPHCGQFLRDHAEDLRSDAFVILDAGNWAPGEPAFTTTLRGVCDAVIEVTTLDHALHSGQYGGPVPDALTALCRLLASLHDEAGDVAIAGVGGTLGFDAVFDPAAFRRDAGLLDGVREIGSGSLADRLWAKPTCTVIGLDTVNIKQSSNTLLPSARARVSLRVPPGMTAEQVLDALQAHCLCHAPWGAQVLVTRGSAGNPAQVPVSGPLVQAGLAAYEQAFGVAPVLVGQGGAIPLVGELSELFPDAELLVTGLADPDARMHAPNESVHFPDLLRTVEAQISFISSLAK